MTTHAQEKVQSTTSTATDEAKSVAGTAKEETANVASEAVHQAKNVTGEAKAQVKDQVSTHAHTQRDNLADFVKTFSNDLDKIRSRQDAPGMANDLIQSASTQLATLGDHIGSKDPAELLTDLQHFARRKPGVFLFGAVAAGIVAGRVVSGLRAGQPHTNYSPAYGIDGTATPLPTEPLTDPSPMDVSVSGEHVGTSGSAFDVNADTHVPRKLESDFGNHRTGGTF